MIQNMITERFICNLLLYKEYVAHKMASTGNYLIAYINTVKEGWPSLTSSCEGPTKVTTPNSLNGGEGHYAAKSLQGGHAPLVPPPPSSTAYGMHFLNLEEVAI